MPCGLNRDFSTRYHSNQTLKLSNFSHVVDDFYNECTYVYSNNEIFITPDHVVTDCNEMLYNFDWSEIID